MAAIEFPQRPEETIGMLVILAGLGVVMWALYRWLLAGPRTPDPWGAEFGAALGQPDVLPVCPHCSAPQQHEGWFCPECGSMVGQYGNWLPGVYIFSIGEAVRCGVHLRVRWNPLLIAGYVLIALTFLPLLLALFYWLFLFLHRRRVARTYRESEELGS